MRLEIVSAADFLIQLLRLQTAASQLSESQLQMFKKSLTDLLGHRYRDHWFPDKPNRGSGYRCIRINGKMDPVIAQAGLSVGLVPNLLRSLPKELTLWVDPGEVSYRIGENGSICVLFEGTVQPVQPASQPQQQQQQQQAAQPTATTTNNNNNNNNSNMFEQHRHHYQQQQQHLQPFHHHQQQQHHYHHHHHHHQQHQQQQQFESCKDSLLLEHTQFNEKLAAYVSS